MHAELPHLAAVMLGAALLASVHAGNAGEFVQKTEQTEDEAKAQLARFAATYTTKEEWLVRAATNREGILRGAGLYPLPEKCPLKPITHNRAQVRRLHRAQRGF